MCRRRTLKAANRPGRPPFFLSGIALGLLCGGLVSSVQAGPAAPGAAAAPVEEVVITGEWAGPKLWKVSRGDHALWLLGTPDTLPRKMTWRSAAIESVLGEVQEVIANGPSLEVNAGPITAIRLYLQWRHVRNNDNGETLQAALPPALYARYAVLKARYAPHDSKLDERRPMVAAGRLYFEALKAAGLTAADSVQETVFRLADRHHVKVHRISLRVEDPRSVLAEVSATPRSAELACFEATLARLETDVGPMVLRARAWAQGDVEQLRRLPYTDNLETCLQQLSGSARVRDLKARGDGLWMAAVESALANNRSTLALYPINALIGKDSMLARLRARGYQVEGP